MGGVAGVVAAWLLVAALGTSTATANDEPGTAPTNAATKAGAQQDAVPFKAVESVTTVIYTEADSGEGAELRDAVERAKAAIDRRDLSAALDELRPAVAWCDAAAQEPGRRAIVVANRQELELARAEAGNVPPLRWLDMACASAIKTQAFIAIEQRRPGDALAILRRLIELAPYWAQAHAELGYALGRNGDPVESLTAYRRALALAERHTSSEGARGLALRGIGWILVEMGDLAGARASYERSLEVEPGNAIALGELEYIRGLEAGTKP